MWQKLLVDLKNGDVKALARSISLVENDYTGYQELLKSLPSRETMVIGITGPPGAGKSTLVDALIATITDKNKKVAVLCVDPSSPFNLGALLGDRVRMSDWYTNPNVFIRSLASHGSMGGLNPKIIEIADIVKAANFDYIIIETVGVGQSEIEIAGIADVTVVVLVPEAGDEVQTMKAGLMEIADIFVVNKSDRPDADSFVKNLRQMLAPTFHRHPHVIPVIKTVASNRQGIDELYLAIENHHELNSTNDKKLWLLTEKAYQMIQTSRMKDISRPVLFKEIEENFTKDFNLYRFVETKVIAS